MVSVSASVDKCSEPSDPVRPQSNQLERMRELSTAFADLEREDPRKQSLWEINAELFGDDGLPT